MPSSFSGAGIGFGRPRELGNEGGLGLIQHHLHREVELKGSCAGLVRGGEDLDLVALHLAALECGVGSILDGGQLRLLGKVGVDTLGQLLQATQLSEFLQIVRHNDSS